MSSPSTTSSRLQGHTAIVTGAAQGIGRALAARLAVDGASVAAVDLTDATETVEAIRSAGGTAAAFVADVADPDQVRALVGRIGAELGAPDILVNNAGIYPFVALEELTLETWRHVFAVNLESQLLMTQAFMGGMKAAGWGRIVNLTSNSVGLQVPDAVHYVSSKMAVIGLTRGLATELAPFGVTVNAVAPSATKTPGMHFATDEMLEGLAQLQTIKRVGQPEDLAGAVAFLASPDAGFTTAQTFFIDGGLVRN